MLHIAAVDRCGRTRLGQGRRRVARIGRGLGFVVTRSDRAAAGNGHPGRGDQDKGGRARAAAVAATRNTQTSSWSISSKQGLARNGTSRAAPHLSRKDDEDILLAPQSRRYCENTEFPRARLVAIVCNEAATPPLWRKAAFLGECFRE